MGQETEYIIECDEYECPRFTKSLSIRGAVWEYPEDDINEN